MACQSCIVPRTFVQKSLIQPIDCISYSQYTEFKLPLRDTTVCRQLYGTAAEPATGSATVQEKVISSAKEGERFEATTSARQGEATRIQC